MKLLTKLTPISASLLLSLGLVSAVHADDSKLSVSGFIDMSYVSAKTDGNSVSVFGVDQVEIDLSYKVDDKLTAYVDVEYQENGVDLEQAYLTYQVTDGFSVKAGRFLSYTGFEAEEPTGLYQYSGTGYAPLFYGYYQQGISAAYSGDKYTVAISLVNDLAGPTSTDSESPGIETMIALMPTDEITIKGFYSTESVDGTGESNDFINVWASYAKDALTLGAEYNSASNGATDTDSTGYLVMANYALTDKVAMTVRYHAYETEAPERTSEFSGITLSPSYAVSDNVLIVAEYRKDDLDGIDEDVLALEALITF
jgi:hypothetical protein